MIVDSFRNAPRKEWRQVWNISTCCDGHSCTHLLFSKHEDMHAGVPSYFFRRDDVISTHLTAAILLTVIRQSSLLVL